METKNFMTVKQMAQKHPFITENALRWHLFKMPDGFSRCVRRIGRRILLEENAYLSWVDGQRP